MELTYLLLFGLELTRFPSGDDAADALTDSVEVLEAGGWSLSPYTGPALQPYIGLHKPAFTLSLAPGLALRSGTASTLEGLEMAVRTVQWRAEVRAWWTPQPMLLGLDVAASGGRASLEGTPLDVGSSALDVAPTVGIRAPLNPMVDLVGRARWIVRSADGTLSQGLGGALAVEMHR